MFKIILFLFINLFCFNIKCFAIFSEHQAGIIDNIINKNNNNNKIVYLTFDACGGKHGMEADLKLINFLKKEKINSTIFVTSKFLYNQKNAELIKELSLLPYIKIQNHGKNHRPASINGKKIYNIRGTKDINELIEEIKNADNLILKITNKKPNWYRSGTAYYDTEVIKIINNLNYNIAGFAITLDAGSTLSKKEIVKNMLLAKNGDILLAHINHPESDTSKGIIKGIKLLKKQGFKFELLP